MGILSESNMGIAVRELFNDAGGIVKDLATLPFRAAKGYIGENGHGNLGYLNAAFSPTMAGVLGGGVVFVGGSEHWPTALALYVGFQYSMDVLMAGKGSHEIFPSLQQKTNNVPREETTFVSYGEAAVDASPEILARVTFVPRQP